jgi:hypothetical protein
VFADVGVRGIAGGEVAAEIAMGDACFEHLARSHSILEAGRAGRITFRFVKTDVELVDYQDYD